MTFFLKSRSRSVHDEPHEEEENKPNAGVCTSLTIWRKSLLLSCNGFTVIDSNGSFVFRVDNYMTHPHKVILMDGSGKPLLSLCRPKKLRLAENWLIYEGEVSTEKKPIWCLRKHSNNILQPNINHVLAYIYRGPSDKRYTYVIEGSYAHRSCKVIDPVSRRVVVAEIKRKESLTGGVSFGLEVFILIVWPGLDPAFAMAIVLLLDQMFS